MLKIDAMVTRVDDFVGSAQVFLPKTAPVSLVAEVAKYALAQELGYRTTAALAVDGYEFAPQGPEWYDGEGDPEAASWAWDYNCAEPTVPAYDTGRTADKHGTPGS